MRSPLPAVVAALAVLTATAVAHSSESAKGSEVQTYGAPVTVKKALKIDKLEKNPAKYNGQTIKLEGVVAKVCQGQGCWIEIASPKGATFIARSLDESVLVPKDCKGQKVTIQGVVTTMPAKAHDHSQAEDGHSCPAPTFVLSTQGVELVAKK